MRYRIEMHENIVLDRFVLSDQASAEITGLYSGGHEKPRMVQI